MTLEEFLRNEFSGPPIKGMVGTQSGWLQLCELAVPSGEIYVGDPLHTLPSLEGFRTRLSGGDYLLETKLLVFGDDVRVSRLRVTKRGSSPIIDQKIGEAWTDAATLLICDSDALRLRVQEDLPHITKKISSAIDGWDHYRLINLDDGSLPSAPLIRTGFGDGRFPIHRLQDRGECVGLELVFIEQDSAYPFEGAATTPYPGQDYHWKLINSFWDPLWSALKQGPDATISFLTGLTAGRRAVLCIDLFNKNVLLHGGLEQFFRFQRGAELLAPHVLSGYRLLSATEFAERFEEIYSRCRSVLDATGVREKMTAWRDISLGPYRVLINGFEDWFRVSMADPTRAIERYIERYVETHRLEFSEL